MMSHLYQLALCQEALLCYTGISKFNTKPISSYWVIPYCHLYQSHLTRSFLTVICLKQMNENWFCACIFFTSFIFQTQFSSLLRILWIPSLIIEDWPIPETKDIDSRTKAITRATKVTQLQAGWCDKMSVRSSPGTGFLVTQLSPRGATKWWGIILIRGEVPVNYTS